MGPHLVSLAAALLSALVYRRLPRRIRTAASGLLRRPRFHKIPQAAGSHELSRLVAPPTWVAVARIVAAQMIGHLLLSRGLWRSPAGSYASLIPTDVSPTLSWQSPRTFPTIELTHMPCWLDGGIYWLMLGALSTLLAAPRRHGRRASACFLIAFSTRVLGDLSRLMPYSFTSSFVLLALAIEPAVAPRVCRLVMGSAWTYAGLLKLNPLLTGAHFSIVAQGPMRALLGEILWDGHQPALSYAVALGEALCGAAVLSAELLQAEPRQQDYYRQRRTIIARASQLSGALLVLMHAVLAVELTRLRFNLVVLPWNIAYAALALLLVVLPAHPHEKAAAPPSSRGGRRVYMAAVVTQLLLPALCPLGAWDSYLSHSLYTGNYDRLTIAVPQPLPPSLAAVRRLHPSCFVGGGARWVDMACWSERELSTPPWHSAWAFRVWARRFCELALGDVDRSNSSVTVRNTAFTVHKRRALPYSRRAAAVRFSCSDTLPHHETEIGRNASKELAPPVAPLLGGLLLLVALDWTMLQPSRGSQTNKEKRPLTMPPLGSKRWVST